jgi:hypothetical protein
MKETLWRRCGALEGNLDFSFLAHQFELTGGNIKNAVMSAAYLAALKEKKIGMAKKHFETARG